ncbi:hypothetical protein [Campylobacter sp. RM16704]|uniref:hypothetical protein n=1 Tax=Campylobacter sp. RM16704 TaxID=1500960 RepID=UPI00057E90DA|nr:hypothetical protein [Campylobacter sp. RM16704]AJC85928.1 hypothetical protein CAQ16704_0423 [Campylobacter sp. RM16704]
MFGFSTKEDIVPTIFKDLEQANINYIFLNLYNALVENELKIPYKYAIMANSIKNIFELRIQDVLKNNPLKPTKTKQFCSYSHKIIKAYTERRLCEIKFEEKIPKYALAKLIQNIFLSSKFIIDPQVAFEAFVYDKICKSNTKAKVDIQKNIIIINEKIAVMPYFFENNKKDIQTALNIIKENSFEIFYIVYPRNKNFNRYKKIRHFLCENNKTLLKLVPYTINNQILRRCK